MIISCPSGSGKTTFCLKLLKRPNIYFNYIPGEIVWYYGEIKPNLHKNIKTIKDLPEEDVAKNSIVILDDLFIESRNDSNVTNLFTRVAHHRNCFVIFITQNMFHQGYQNRTRNLNCHYLYCLKTLEINYKLKHLPDKCVTQ